MPDTSETASARDIIDFWLAAGEQKWFRKDAAFDRTLTARFGATLKAACDGRLDDWRTEPDGCLALILLFDQFSRNIHRDTPAMFAQDARARALASEALAQNWDAPYPPALRRWFYMPFMHSESLADQKRCLALFRRAALPQPDQNAAQEHADIIARFGRFPHRNQVLGRASSEEEKRFLADGGFAG